MLIAPHFIMSYASSQKNYPYDQGYQRNVFEFMQMSLSAPLGEKFYLNIWL